MRHLWVIPVLFFAGCAMTAEQATAATAATVPVVVALLNSWLSAGILTPEQHAEAMAVFQQMGSSFQSIMELVRIWSGNTAKAMAVAEEARQAAEEAAGSSVDYGTFIESLVGTGAASAVLGGTVAKRAVNRERDLKRKARGEKV